MIIIKYPIKQHKHRLFVLFVLVLFLLVPYLSGKANAAALTEASIRLDRMGAAIAVSASDPILIVAKPASTATEAFVMVSWPTTNAFTVDAVAANHTVTTTGIPSTYQGESLVAWPGIGTATLVATGDVSFPSTTLTAGTLYGFFITGGITNPATGDAGTHLVTITTQDSVPATIDTTQVAVDTTTTDADLVTVTATVPANFNFALSGTSIALGTLAVGSITTGNVTVDIDTNSNNGWVAFIRSEGAGATLASAITGDSLASTGTINGATETVSAGTENYVVDVAAAQGGSSTGALTEAAEYAGNGTTTGGTLNTSYELIADSTGQALNDTLTLTSIVAISNLTAAGTDYTDIWEVVGAGNF